MTRDASQGFRWLHAFLLGCLTKRNPQIDAGEDTLACPAQAIAASFGSHSGKQAPLLCLPVTAASR